MKNLITKTKQKYILLICFFISGLIFSQEESTSRELYQAYVSNVKKTDLETNFLFNKAFISNDEIESLYQFIEGFNEETNEIVAPMSNMDGISWINFYTLILQSELSPEKPLPTLGNISDAFLDQNFESTGIPILFFDVEGELLSAEEIESSINGEVKTTPFNSINMFGASSYINTFYKKDVSFKLDPSNYFTGLESEKPNDIYIDFSDGRGVQNYDFTTISNVQVSYPNIGEKIVKVYKDANLNDNEMRIGTSFIISIKTDNVKEPSTIIEDSLPTVTAKLSDETPIVTSGGKAYCYYGNDGVLDKPVIIVQGFDPIGEITVDSQRDKYSIFDDALIKNNDLDLVFVMFDNTNLSLQNNTNVLKNLIKQINTQKQGNFDSVLIGESMGGLISRMALKQFENENYDHNTSLYVSFDAPHQGANIPPGVQHLFKDVLESRVVTGIAAILTKIDVLAIALTNFIITPFTDERIPNLRDVLYINMAYDALEALNSTAAKSMLVRHISGNSYFNATQNTLTDLGYPSLTRNIALVNGSNDNNDLQTKGDGSDLIPGEKIIDFPIWESDCNELSLSAWSSLTNTTSRVSQIKWQVGLKVVPNIRIVWKVKCFLGVCTKVPTKVTVGFSCGSFNLQNTERNYSFNGASYDNAPGSTLPGLDSDLIEISSDLSFVPTASAIDINSTAYNGTTDPNGLRAISSATEMDNIVINNQTPFDDVYSKNGNSTHVSFKDNDDEDNFSEIIQNEIMSENLRLQNRNIPFNRDFEANESIVVGNNINNISGKIIETGDVIIENNAEVSFTAGSQIFLRAGTLIKSGTNVNIKVESEMVAKSKTSDFLEDYFNISVIGDKFYEFGEKPAFKALTSNSDNTYSYQWEIQDDDNLSAIGDEFIIDEVLYPGNYLLKVNVTSNKTGVSRSITKVFNIKNGLESLKEDVLKVAVDSNSVQYYPNPTIEKVTIITTNDLKEVILYNIQGKEILRSIPEAKKWISLDLSSYANGVYIAHLIFNDNTSVKNKIIKE